MPFTNPIIPGFHPDPSICRVGHDYFLVTSSFEYFPGVPLFHSRDLVNWRLIGHCLDRPSQLPLAGVRPSGGIYAPTLRHHDGVFYMVTTNVTNGGNFYVHTRDPFGPWSEPVWVEQGGIDPSLLFDGDRMYLTTSYGSAFPVPDEIDPATFQWGVQQSVIDIATGRIVEQPRLIWSGTGGKYPEAPHLYRIGDSYYLMIAEGGTEYGHMETIAHSGSPWGPWEPCPHNPILTHRSHQSPFQGLGHADLVEAHDGSWWAVCLGFRPQGYPPVYHLGRETFLAPVRWDAEGWPQIGEAGRVRVSVESPRLQPSPWQPPPARDDFDGPALGLVWNFLGNPAAESWSLAERPGALRLLGSAARLDDGPPVTFVGRRQQHLACEASALLEFAPAAEGEEAGLTVWMNPRHHYDLFVVGAGASRELCVRQRVGDLGAVVARRPLPDGPVVLRIRAEPERYTFGYDTEADGPQTLAHGQTRYLATEVAGGFTGVYLAMYATGGGTPAFFEWFDYQP
ncbi:MAG TPA: glycoside hydrolase family 43 protein [Roseiflexaceae bacterium]|nr:glycoside hydrolase family 43 protein [Roseiflexaceae bacterium]